jgi:hypothetical protein
MAENIFLTTSGSIQAIIEVSSFIIISKYCKDPIYASQNGELHNQNPEHA